MPRSLGLFVSLLAFGWPLACHPAEPEASRELPGSPVPSLGVPSEAPKPLLPLSVPAPPSEPLPKKLLYAYGFEPKLEDWILTRTEESSCGMSWAVTPRLGRLPRPAKLEACYGPDPYETIRVRTDCVKKGTLQSERHVIELCLDRLRRTTASGMIDILQLYEDGLGPRLRLFLDRFPRDSISSLIDQIAKSRSHPVHESEQVWYQMKDNRELLARAPSVFLNGLYSDHE